MSAMVERKVGFADMYGTTAAVEVDDDGDIRTEVMVGQCGATGYPTPEAARQFAALLLDAADASEKAQAEAGEGQ
jgi:hypothetical protein